MDRRAVLRTLLLGAASSSGCLTTRSADSETTATESTSTSEITLSETQPTATETTPHEMQTASTEPKSTSDACPSSAVPSNRVHRHSDYGLEIVREATHEPAVAVVGADWRSTLETDAMSEADEAFVTDTDFEQFIVLVAQYEKSSSGHSLRVTAAAIDGDTVRAELCVTVPGGPNDAPTENLFVQLPYSGTPPSTAKLRIETPTGTVTVSNE